MYGWCCCSIWSLFVLSRWYICGCFFLQCMLVKGIVKYYWVFLSCYLKDWARTGWNNMSRSYSHFAADVIFFVTSLLRIDLYIWYCHQQIIIGCWVWCIHWRENLLSISRFCIQCVIVKLGEQSFGRYIVKCFGKLHHNYISLNVIIVVFLQVPGLNDTDWVSRDLGALNQCWRSYKMF